MKINFSPPEVTEHDIQAVVDVLQSGWITTGPMTKQFEEGISNFCHTKHTVCVSSATSGMELALRLFGIGAGDEVITTAYTYSASASVIQHVGAKIVLCDTSPDSFFMDYDQLEQLITPQTKAIIPVDVGGVPADYARIMDIVERKRDGFSAANAHHQKLGRILVLSDAAHSFGASRKDRMTGQLGDITCFSFHAVKNLTTAEGGAITWNLPDCFDSQDIYRELHLLTLHGQTKDALAKMSPGKWEYDIAVLGYKANMTDIYAALGKSQLSRYDDILARRKAIVEQYNRGFAHPKIMHLEHFAPDYHSSYHLYLVRLMGKDEHFRNQLIEKMAEYDIATNVHYKPLPMFTAYQNLGFDIKDFPNAFDQYRNVISIPVHSLIDKEASDYVIESFWKCYHAIEQATV